MTPYSDSVMKNTTLKQISSLSIESRRLFAEILIDEIVNTADVENRDGWQELVDEDLVNSWTDDAGSRYTNIGNQQ
jgi:hypothetical protein